MATILNISIKHQNLEDIFQQVEKYYSIGRVRWKKTISTVEFFKPPYQHRTFILHKGVSTSWVELEISLFNNLYELDEMLRRITAKLDTIAIICYNQTTSRSFRFALFKKGSLLRSIWIKYVEPHNERRLMDNFGEKLPFETVDFCKPFVSEVPEEQLLDHNICYQWCKELGRVHEEQKNIDYLHLEVKDFKN